jgi:hypothetical protein
LPTISPHLRDMNHVLNEDSFVGEWLRSLTGHHDDLSCVEVVGNISY